MKNVIFFLVSVLSSLLCNAQSGELDLTFNAADSGFENGDGADGTIFCTALQADGKILIGGNFTKYNGQPISKLARINSDGTLDPTFITTASSSFPHAKSIVVQDDGKIIANGRYRLNPDGSRDNSFNWDAECCINVYAAKIQPDGKIIIVGDFLNGKHIARLNTDGSTDTTFDPGAGAMLGITQYNHVTNISNAHIQADGKIIIIGNFNVYNGVPRSYIARLNPDGSIDPDFAPLSGFGFDPPYDHIDLNTISFQPDGKMTIGGSFNRYDGVEVNGLVRVNPNGTLDPTFSTGNGLTYVVSAYFGGNGSRISKGEVLTTILQPDGKILVGGNFDKYQGISVGKNIIRLNADGSLDTTFITNKGIAAGNNMDPTLLYGKVKTMALQPDGKIIAGGEFGIFDRTRTGSLVRLEPTGVIDVTCNIGSGANFPVSLSQIQPDGKILIGGDFSKFNGDSKKYLNRLNQDGTVDSSFDIGSGFSTSNNDGSYPEVKSIAIQPDGKIIVGGYFNAYNGIAKNGIVRLNSNGTIDNSFNTVFTQVDRPVSQIGLQPDGKILIINVESDAELIRLNQNGSIDSSFFRIGYPECLSFSLQSDGKILHQSSHGLGLRRLNSDGTIDAAFTIVSTDFRSVITLQPDGKILLSGIYQSFNGIGIGNIARLNQNGSPDFSFLPTGIESMDHILTVKVQNDGKILIGGYHSGAQNWPSLYRLNSNGSVDTTFNSTGSGPMGASFFWSSTEVQHINIQSDNKILIGGSFTSYNGIGRNRFARLYGSDPLNVPENELLDLKIYPNPATTQLHIETSQNFEIKSIDVYDLLGRLVLVAKNPKLSQIDVSALISGTYIVKASNNNGTISKKFVKQ